MGIIGDGSLQGVPQKWSHKRCPCQCSSPGGPLHGDPSRGSTSECPIQVVPFSLYPTGRAFELVSSRGFPPWGLPIGSFHGVTTMGYPPGDTNQGVHCVGYSLEVPSMECHTGDNLHDSPLGGPKGGFSPDGLHHGSLPRLPQQGVPPRVFLSGGLIHGVQFMGYVPWGPYVGPI